LTADSTLVSHAILQVSAEVANVRRKDIPRGVASTGIPLLKWGLAENKV